MLVTVLATALAGPPVVAASPQATEPAKTWKSEVEPFAALVGGGGVLTTVGVVIMAQAAVSAVVIEGRIYEDEALDSEGYAEHERAWRGAQTRWKVGAGIAGAGLGVAGAGLVMRFGADS